MKKFLFLLLIIVPLIFAGCSQTEETPAGNIILFVSESCGHCAQVKDYINKNNISTLVEYTEIQAYETEENYAFFQSKASECGIDENQRGVPMVYEKGSCEMGSPDVIRFFENKVK